MSITASSAVRVGLLPAVLASMVAGCGGVGSDSEGRVTEPPPPLAVTPTALSATSVEGQLSAVTALVSFAGHVDIMIPPTLRFDYDASIIGSVDTRPAGPRTAFVTLVSSQQLQVGEHSDTVGLYVCTSPSCLQFYSSTPVLLAYQVAITPAPTGNVGPTSTTKSTRSRAPIDAPVPALDAIPTLTGLPEWETYQGNPAHTGHVPVTLDKARFTSGWSWTSPFPYTHLSPVTTSSGLAVVSATGHDSPGYLVALNEADGTTAWQHGFGSVHGVEHPAASAGRVFVATSGHQDAAMWSFELATGQQLFRTAFEAQGEHYLAPTFKNGLIYTNGGYYGGMYAFTGHSGVMRWFAELAQYDLWSPAVDDAHAYVHTGNEWVAVNHATGIQSFAVPSSTFNWRGYSLNIAPVIDTPDTLVVVDGVYDHSAGTRHDNHLIRYSISGRSELWRVNGSFASNPATSNGRIYVLNTAPDGLDVYDAASGAKLWSWAAPEDIPTGNLVVTDNLVFARTRAATYAIDVATRQHVWSTPRTGHLALSSNGVLYIVAPERIDAYELL